MKKLFLSAGHQAFNNIDPGAIANGVKEADLTLELRNLIVHNLRDLDNVQIIVDDDTENLRDTMNHMARDLSASDYAIDIHFNAGVPSANGTESFIPDNYSSFEFAAATALNRTIISVLKTYNRGVKTESQSAHKRLGFMRPDCQNILLEICFITNVSDHQKYQFNKQTLALNLANTIKTLY